VSLEQEKAKSVPGTDLSVLEQERQIVADVKQKLAQQTELAMALQKENELLKQQLAAAAPVQAPSSTGAASELAKQQLEAAKSTIAALQTSNLALRTEQLLLQSRVADLTKHPGKRAQPAPGPGEQNSQLENALARLAVYESKPVPYTAEELALFKQPDLKASVAVAQAGPAKKAVKELPPGAGPIMEEAKRAAENGRLEEAEKKFQEVLRQDEKNTYTLGHLAAVQIEQNRLGDAEKTINQALGVDPRDPACLFTLGLLKYRQEKYDAALDALSLSASLIPDEPRTQYFLGKTLIEKGNRTAAEAALRKAVQLRPGWSEAHFSLAMVYATQQPPFKELAQWHYQKAIEKGYPRNLEFEKLLEEKRPSTAGQ
jgi:tetratricopeptide (TPR) repeat protein